MVRLPQDWGLGGGSPEANGSGERSALTLFIISNDRPQLFQHLQRTIEFPTGGKRRKHAGNGIGGSIEILHEFYGFGY